MITRCFKSHTNPYIIGDLEELAHWFKANFFAQNLGKVTTREEKKIILHEVISKPHEVRFNSGKVRFTSHLSDSSLLDVYIPPNTV